MRGCREPEVQAGGGWAGESPEDDEPRGGPRGPGSNPPAPLPGPVSPRLAAVGSVDREVSIASGVVESVGEREDPHEGQGHGHDAEDRHVPATASRVSHSRPRDRSTVVAQGQIEGRKAGGGGCGRPRPATCEAEPGRLRRA